MAFLFTNILPLAFRITLGMALGSSPNLSWPPESTLRRHVDANDGGNDLGLHSDDDAKHGIQAARLSWFFLNQIYSLC